VLMAQTMRLSKGNPLTGGLPDCLKKRRLLNEKELSPALCQDYGEKFLALGWWEDALEFFRRGKVDAGLEKLRAHGLESGDAFLLSRLGPQSSEVWRQVAEQALKLGKIEFARRAWERAGDREKAAALGGLDAGDALRH